MTRSGPIPPGFQAQEGELVVAGRRAGDWAVELGTPCFVYSAERVVAQVAAFRSAMLADVALLFAAKANPFGPLLQLLRQHVDGLDIASGGELRAALAAGWQGPDLSFAGPGKSDAELGAAIEAGTTISLESAGEVDRVLAIAQRAGRAPRLAIRINPPFEVRGAGLRMGGTASPFGLDVDQVVPLVKRLQAEQCEWRGLHVYAATQSLDADALAQMQAETIALAAQVATEAGAPLPLVNLGGGFGVPYFAGERPLDVSRIGRALAEQLASRPPSLRDTRFAIELGRWLVADAGVYLTRVVDRKISRGQTILIVDGGLHHMLAATGNLGAVVRRAWPIALANRWGSTQVEPQTVAGCLCTPLDRFGADLPLAPARPGDLVAVFMAGAYGASASPVAFLGHGPAAEVLA